MTDTLREEDTSSCSPVHKKRREEDESSDDESCSDTEDYTVAAKKSHIPPIQWPRLTADYTGGERAPLFHVDLVDPHRARRLYNEYRDKMEADDRLHLEKLIEQMDDNGRIPTDYRQSDYSRFFDKTKYNGATRFGRFYSQTGSQKSPSEIRDSLFGYRMVDIDLVNAHPRLASQLLRHLPLPTYFAYAEDRSQFEASFFDATGLGMKQMKTVVASIMYGARQYGVKPKKWEKLLKDETLRANMQMRGITSIASLNKKLSKVKWLKDLRAERAIIYKQIKHDFPEFWKMCISKAAEDKKAGADPDDCNVGGIAFSLLMHDVEAAILVVMVKEALNMNLKGPDFLPFISLMHDGMRLVKIDDPQPIIDALEAVVKEETGFVVNLIVKPMDKALPGYEGPEPYDADDNSAPLNEERLPDTTRKNSRPAPFGRNIRKLSGQTFELKALAEEIAKTIVKVSEELEKASNEEEEKELRSQLESLRGEIDRVFSELFYHVGTNMYIAVTNTRRVVVNYYVRSMRDLKDSEFKSLSMEINIWIKNFRCKSYTRAVYSYSGHTAPNVFNLWTGFKVEQDMDIKEPEKLIDIIDPWHPDAEDPAKHRSILQPMINHIFRMVGKSQPHFKVMLCDLADSVQNPHRRPTHAWIVEGEQGAGKSRGVKLMFEPIYGIDNPDGNECQGTKGMFLMVGNSKHILKKFNAILENRKVIALDDEQEEGKLKQNRGEAKNFITDEMIMIEAKFKDSQAATMCALIFILTNDGNVVDLEDKHQRRWLLVIMSDEMKHNPAYFDDLIALMKTPEARAEWFQYLMRYDIQGYNRYSPELPQTDAMKQEYVSCRPPMATFIAERFLSQHEQEPHYHCLRAGCNDIHYEDTLCKDGRKPVPFVLSWDNETYIPRKVYAQMYGAWLTAQQRDGNVPRGKSVSNNDQVKKMCKYGIMRNGVEGGTAAAREWIEVPVYKEEEETVTEAPMQAPGKKSGATGGVYKTITRKTMKRVLKTIHRERPNCYVVPPLKEVWAIMVDRGFLLDTTPMPTPDAEEVIEAGEIFQGCEEHQGDTEDSLKF